jgi:hypothetical protein
MVHIPTTERQYYNTTKKVNTLGAYASALSGAADDYRKELVKQQQIKVDTESTKMRVESDKFVQEWRLANQANPDNEEAKAQLQSGLQEIYGRYGNNIDPIAKMDWDIAVNKINSAYEMANNQWAINQRAQNTKLDVADGMNANFELARGYGRSGNLAGALADYANSYSQLNAYASQNMGATEARELLDNYDEDFLTNYLSGLAEVDANAAMETLKNPEVAKVFAGEDSEEMMTKIINKQIAKQDFDTKVRQFKTEQKLSLELDNADPLDALKVLEQNEGNVSPKYFKARQKSLTSALGITAETRADEATEILLDIAALPKDEGTVAYYSKSNEILTKIEDRYASGRLSTSDRKKLISQVSKGQGKNISALKSEGSGLMFWDFSYEDANEFIKDNYSGANGNQILLEYFRRVNDQDFDNTQKKDVLKDLIRKANANHLNTPSFTSVEEAQAAFNSGKLRKGSQFFLNGKLKKVD